VSNDLTDQVALNTELRSLSARAVLWSVASETPHGVSFHPHFPSVTFGDAIIGVPFQCQPQQRPEG
jgi:hypothetical protein